MRLAICALLGCTVLAVSATDDTSPVENASSRTVDKKGSVAEEAAGKAISKLLQEKISAKFKEAANDVKGVLTEQLGKSLKIAHSHMTPKKKKKKVKKMVKKIKKKLEKKLPAANAEEEEPNPPPPAAAAAPPPPKPNTVPPKVHNAEMGNEMINNDNNGAPGPSNIPQENNPMPNPAMVNQPNPPPPSPFNG